MKRYKLALALSLMAIASIQSKGIAERDYNIQKIQLKNKIVSNSSEKFTEVKNINYINSKVAKVAKEENRTEEVRVSDKNNLKEVKIADAKNTEEELKENRTTISTSATSEAESIQSEYLEVKKENSETLEEIPEVQDTQSQSDIINNSNVEENDLYEAEEVTEIASEESDNTVSLSLIGYTTDDINVRSERENFQKF